MDAETGILLRFERILQNRPVQIVEFTDLEKVGEPDDALFRPPQADSADLTESGSSAEGIQGQTINSSRASSAVSNDLVNLLYRTASKPQEFSAMLHEWADQDANARAADSVIESSELPQWAHRIGQVGAHQRYGKIDLTARVQLALPGCYRIDSTSSHPPQPNSTICDKTRLWSVFTDRIVSKPAAPLPAGIALLIDLAWLLSGYELTPAGSGMQEGGRLSGFLQCQPAMRSCGKALLRIFRLSPIRSKQSLMLGSG